MRLRTTNQYQNIDFFEVQIGSDPVIQVPPTAVDPGDPDTAYILDFDLPDDFPIGTTTVTVTAVRMVHDDWTGEDIEQRVSSDPFDVTRNPLPSPPEKPVLELVAG